MSNFLVVEGGVCAALDFVAGGIHCGIQATNRDRVDLAMVYSRRNAVGAATFTTNRIKAAPVQVSMSHMSSRNIRAVVLNSGNANACTGQQGIEDALRMAGSTAKALSLQSQQVLVCSTGRIGVPLPMAKIEPGLEILANSISSAGGQLAAEAIMTSDTHPKETAREWRIADLPVRLGGMAKGAGMINPDMATMLCVLTTDVAISSTALRRALRDTVRGTFNRITIDGDTSTNDTVIILANGASKAPIVQPGTSEYIAFCEALESVCAELARMIVLDGEGVSKFVEVIVRRASNTKDARLAAEAVANSILLKCAWAGNDPNWGRIMDALGYSNAQVQEGRIDIFLDELPMVVGGIKGPSSLEALRKAAAKNAFRIEIDLNQGTGEYKVLTTDLTEKYVQLNYRE